MVLCLGEVVARAWVPRSLHISIERAAQNLLQKLPLQKRTGHYLFHAMACSRRPNQRSLQSPARRPLL